jgi:hypothetical protein
MTHTPGPWHNGNVLGNWWKIYDENGCFIASANDPSPAPNHKADGFDIAHANARLIAAAPDLLEALDRLVWECDTNNGYDSNLEGSEHDAIEAARAAIAKAKGQS